MVDVVEQIHVRPQPVAERREQLRYDVEVQRGVPHRLLGRCSSDGRLVVRAFRDAVRAFHARDARLHPYGAISALDVVRRRFHGGGDRVAARVAVDHHPLARRSAEELIDRRVQRLALEIPQRRVDGRDRRHRDGSAPPVRAFVEVLPDIFDAPRVPPDDQRQDMVAEITRDRELASVQRRVAEAVDAVLRFELQRDKVASGAADDDFATGDSHVSAPQPRGSRLSAAWSWCRP